MEKRKEIEANEFDKQDAENSRCGTPHRLHDIAKYRPFLLRYAQAHLRSREQAEDAVQETMLSAVQSIKNFHGRSSLGTWLISILRHKIVDGIRSNYKHRQVFDHSSKVRFDDFENTFSRHGDFDRISAEYANPEYFFLQKEFFQELERCLSRLPPRTSRAFLLREALGFDYRQIGQELGISVNNCWILLYRARMTLRQCLGSGLR